MTTTWTEADMIDAACEFWGDDCRPADCTVIEDDGSLVVLHRPTGRTSAEAGDGGRWRLDGTVR